MTPSERHAQETREPVLDTIDRVSELCFGLFMALTFVGAVSAVTAGEDAGRKMLFSALGCNIAWGLADAVMFLVRTLTNRGRRLTLAVTIKREQDAAIAIHVLRDALPKAMKSLVADAELEQIRARLAASQFAPGHARFVRDDFIGAAGIFLIVVISTFPVALPFVVFKNVSTALFVSRVLTLVMLFSAGFALGRFSGAGGLRAGLSMMTLGVVLTIAIIALGG
ncbi:VIT1/CCC1 transporter family protein [Paraburkholderia sp. C35]|uniref:VIT1/CCC1 transporter family protein n=1 Tax=Paraburkholderia sp. C35 TaxID=2126993 RepID=UPI000D6881A9|nr:VIT1/CCC1 transporter family protein [Paraburkholderia sp. C35]